MLGTDVLDLFADSIERFIYNLGYVAQQSAEVSSTVHHTPIHILLPALITKTHIPAHHAHLNPHSRS